MMYLILILLILSITCNVFLFKKLLSASDQLLERDSQVDLLNDYVNTSYSLLQDVFNELQRLSQTPTISNEPYVVRLVMIINRSKNAIKSLIDSLSRE